MKRTRKRGSDHLPIDSRHAGLRNERLVLSLLRQHGGLSQAQLCKLAGLSSSTACYIVGRLREKALITESRGTSGRRGAKPVIVSIRPRAQVVVGIEISPTSIFLGLFDFNCDLIESLRAAIPGDHSPEAVVNLVEISTRGLLSKHGINDDNLLGVGLTVSGAISQDGVVQLSAPMGWKAVPLRQLVQERFQATVLVFTTRVRMFAELTQLPPRSASHIVLLNFADGVGASIAENGKLVHGATSRAGEIGHIVFDSNGPLCGCGHRGCLETFASGPALAGRIRHDLQDGVKTVLRDLIDPDDSPRDVLDHFGRALADGDAYALEVRDLIADYVSRATAIAINCYDPDLLILAGYVVAQSPDYFIRSAKDRISSDVFDHYSRDITILVDRSGEESLIRGIATAVMNHSMEQF
jgi:predicted NBD/HSP70 family sugar kinase